MKTKDSFPESLGLKHGCAVYMGAHCTWQNTVRSLCCTVHPHDYFITTNLFFLIPSPFPPSSLTLLPSGNHQPVLCNSESVSILFVHLFCSLNSTYTCVSEIVWFQSFSVRLVSLNLIPSSSILPPQMPKFHSLRQRNIQLCKCITFFIHSFTDGHLGYCK